MCGRALLFFFRSFLASLGFYLFSRTVMLLRFIVAAKWDCIFVDQGC